MACFLKLYGCYDSDQEKATRKKGDEAVHSYVQGMENQILFKMNLLFLKHEILSEGLKKEFVEYVISKYPIIQMLKSNTEDTNKRIQEIIDNRQDLLAIDKLEALSIKYDVPLSKLAALLYDYVVLKAIEDGE